MKAPTSPPLGDIRQADAGRPPFPQLPTTSTGQGRRWAWRLSGALVLCFALGAAACVTTVRSAIGDPRWIEAARASVEDATGLRIAFETTPVVHLFPRPRLEVSGVDIQAERALSAHAVAVEGVVALLPLFRGTVVFDRIRLDDVTGTLDADALAHAFHAETSGENATGGRGDTALPQRVTVTSGFLQIRSRSPAASGFLSEIHAVADGIRGVTTVSGGATWHGERGEVSARLDSLARFLRAEPTTGTVRLKAAPIGATLAGTWAQGWRGGFAGSINATSPDFPSLMRTLGAVPGPLSGVRSVGLAATAEPGATGLALSAARLTVNGSTLEGTLGVQVANGRPVIVGTLATDDLDLDPILATQPALRDGSGAWNSEPAPFVLGDLRDVDVRISAGRIRLKGLVAEDAALSALSSGTRQELSLGEARAYGGLMKARFATSGSADGVTARLDASWSQFDLPRLAAAAGVADSGLSGTTSGHLAVEGEGTNIAALVHSLSGKGQVNLIGVEAGSTAVGRLLRAGAGVRAPAPGIAFDLAAFDLRVNRGTVVVDKGAVSATDSRWIVSGAASLSDRSFALAARAGGDALAPTAGDTAWHVAGVWGGPVHWTAPTAVAGTAAPGRETEIMP